MRPRAGRNFRRERLNSAEKRLLRLLLRVSLSMPKREAQGKYVPCENASGAELFCKAKKRHGKVSGKVKREQKSRGN